MNNEKPDFEEVVLKIDDELFKAKKWDTWNGGTAFTLIGTAPVFSKSWELGDDSMLQSLNLKRGRKVIEVWERISCPCGDPECGESWERKLTEFRCWNSDFNTVSLTLI